nr:hypothetical protein CFP56_64172 [Quercus suber]
MNICDGSPPLLYVLQPGVPRFILMFASRESASDTHPATLSIRSPFQQAQYLRPTTRDFPRFSHPSKSGPVLCRIAPGPGSIALFHFVVSVEFRNLRSLTISWRFRLCLLVFLVVLQPAGVLVTVTGGEGTRVSHVRIFSPCLRLWEGCFAWTKTSI